MNWQELLIGQIPEAIYFALFLILSKQLKTKRFLFIVLMVLEEILLIRIFPESIWFQILYTALTFIILKILYKEKAQITDIFTFTISSLILFIVNIISYVVIYLTVKNFSFAVIISRLILAVFLILFRNKLYKIHLLYKKFWNRDDRVKKRMKSTTFRCINLIIFNLMFYLANIALLITVYRNGGV